MFKDIISVLHLQNGWWVTGLNFIWRILIKFEGHPRNIFVGLKQIVGIWIISYSRLLAGCVAEDYVGF